MSLISLHVGGSTAEIGGKSAKGGPSSSKSGVKGKAHSTKGAAVNEASSTSKRGSAKVQISTEPVVQVKLAGTR